MTDTEHRRASEMDRTLLLTQGLEKQFREMAVMAEPIVAASIAFNVGEFHFVRAPLSVKPANDPA